MGIPKPIVTATPATTENDPIVNKLTTPKLMVDEEDEEDVVLEDEATIAAQFSASSVVPRIP